jgi:hypothetical protein
MVRHLGDSAQAFAIKIHHVFLALGDSVGRNPCTWDFSRSWKQKGTLPFFIDKRYFGGAKLAL